MRNPLFIAYPSAQYMPAQVRALLDFLVDEFPQLDAAPAGRGGELGEPSSIDASPAPRSPQP